MQVPMAVAAERAISSQQRELYLSGLAHLPLRLQHNTAAILHMLNGSCLSYAGDHNGALKEYQHAADIGYAVRGGGIIERYKDV